MPSQNPPAQNRISCRNVTLSRLWDSFLGFFGKSSSSQYAPAPIAEKIKDTFQYRSSTTNKTTSAMQIVTAHTFLVKADQLGAYHPHMSIDTNQTVNPIVSSVTIPSFLYHRKSATGKLGRLQWSKGDMPVLTYPPPGCFPIAFHLFGEHYLLTVKQFGKHR